MCTTSFRSDCYFRVPNLITTTSSFFFFNDTATTEIYTLSLHDALPISRRSPAPERAPAGAVRRARARVPLRCPSDRKSTRLNSSHSQISYAVFCLKKKKTTTQGPHSHLLSHTVVTTSLSSYSYSPTPLP